jgi:hypothetical protein
MANLDRVSQNQRSSNELPTMPLSQRSTDATQPHNYIKIKDNKINQLINPHKQVSSKNILEKAWDGIKNFFNPAPEKEPHTYSEINMKAAMKSDEAFADAFKALLEQNKPPAEDPRTKLQKQGAQRNLLQNQAVLGVALTNRLQRSQSL